MARSRVKQLTHVVDVYERGGRFGEDIESVRCRFCGTVWDDPAKFSRLRIGDRPCPSRSAVLREEKP